MRRSGMATGVLLIAALGVLTGCAGGDTAPVVTSVSAPTASVVMPAATVTPAPTDSATPAALPTACGDLGTTATRQQTVGGLTPQQGEGFRRPAPEGATLALGCNWIQEESAAVLVLISTAPDSAVTTAIAGLSSQGYRCQAAEDFGAQYCAKDGASPETEDVVVARGGVWIFLETVDVNARAWLSEIAGQIFG